MAELRHTVNGHLPPSPYAVFRECVRDAAKVLQNTMWKMNVWVSQAQQEKGKMCGCFCFCVAPGSISPESALLYLSVWHHSYSDVLDHILLIELALWKRRFINVRLPACQKYFTEPGITDAHFPPACSSSRVPWTYSLGGFHLPIETFMELSSGEKGQTVRMSWWDSIQGSLSQEFSHFKICITPPQHMPSVRLSLSKFCSIIFRI